MNMVLNKLNEHYKHDKRKKTLQHRWISFRNPTDKMH